MRKLSPILVFLLATSAFAQSNSFSVFLSNPGGGWSQTKGSVRTGGYGLEYQHQLASQWSVAASVASEEYNVLVNQGSIRLNVLPVDLTARYHIFNGARWRPYAGAGVRYVPAPDIAGTAARVTPELNAGVAFQVMHSFGLFVDAKQGLRRTGGPTYDPLAKVSFGLRFGF